MDSLKQKTFYWFLLVASVVWCLTEATGEGDFFIFMSAGGDLSEGINIYQKKYGDGYHYYYSVLFASLLRPFYTLPFFWVKFCWVSFNLLLYVLLFRLLSRLQLLDALPKKKKQLFLWLVFLFSFRFLRDNLHTSQITILILACTVFGLRDIARGKSSRGAALLALGINIKLLPIVFLPWLLYRGHFRALALTVFFYGLSLLLPSLLVGHDYNCELLQAWWHIINPVNKQHVLDTDERSFHGLSTLLSTLLVAQVPDALALPLKRNIADVPLYALAAALQATRGALALLTLYFLRWPPFRPAKSSAESCVEVSYLLLLIPLIFPHQQHYAFLFAVPAFACVLFFLLQQQARVSPKIVCLVASLLALIYLSANLKLLLGNYNRYYEHYKILTYGALLLIPLLVWAARRARENRSE